MRDIVLPLRQKKLPMLATSTGRRWRAHKVLFVVAKLMVINNKRRLEPLCNGLKWTVAHVSQRYQGSTQPRDKADIACFQENANCLKLAKLRLGPCEFQ